jgi:hypothetical protein
MWSEFFYGQGQYGNVLMFILIGITCVIHLINTDNKNLRIGVSVFLFLINFYINSTSVRYLAFFVAPTLVSLSYIFFEYPDRRKKITSIFSIVFISTIAGQILFSWLKHHYEFQAGVNHASYISYNDILNLNINRVLVGFLTLINDPVTGTGLAKINGLLFLWRLIFAVTFFGSAYYFLLSKNRSLLKTFSDSEKYIVIFFGILAFISIYSAIFTELSVNEVAAGRYLMLSAFLGVFVSVIFIQKNDERNIDHQHLDIW